MGGTSDNINVLLWTTSRGVCWCNIEGLALIVHSLLLSMGKQYNSRFLKSKTPRITILGDHDK